MKCFRCGGDNKGPPRKSPVHGLTDRGGAPVEAYADDGSNVLRFVPMILGTTDNQFGRPDTNVTLCQDCAGAAVAFLKGQAVPAPPKIVQKDLITA